MDSDLVFFINTVYVIFVNPKEDEIIIMQDLMLYCVYFQKMQ